MTYITSYELEKPRRIFKSAPVERSNMEIPCATEERLAGAKAEKIVRDARFEAEITLKKANDSSAEVCRKAHEKGFQEGHAKGLEQAEKDAHDKFDKLLTEMNQALEEIQAVRLAIKEKLGESIVHLALDIASKTIKSEITTNRETVSKLAEKVLAGIAPAHEAVLKVSPRDYEIVREFSHDLESAAGYPEKFRINADPLLDSGDVVVIYERGTVDAKISTQLENIVRSLLGSEM